MPRSTLPLPTAQRAPPRHDERLVGRVDEFTQECLAIEVDGSLTGARVVEVLTQLAQARPLARTIVVDNGPEFSGRVLDAWAYRRGITLGVHSARQADAECFHRELQQSLAG